MRIILHTETDENKFNGVYVKDFGDNYHRTANEPSSELEKEARKIRRRYRNIMQYLDAVAVYEEYMAWLQYKHGGKEMFRLKLREEVIPEFIPSKPRMKNNAHNRQLLKKKIIVSQVNFKKFDKSKVKDFVEEISDTLEDENNLIIDTETPMTKLEKKVIKTTPMNSLKMKNLMTQADSLDFLEEYFQNQSATKKSKEEDVLKNISVTDIIEGKVDHIIYSDDENDDDIIYYQGNYMKRSAVNELKVYEEIGKLGWDAVKLMKRGGVSNKYTKVLKRRNKRVKKNKKKDKRRKADDFLLHTVMGTDHDTFADFEQEMMTFTAENIFNN